MADGLNVVADVVNAGSVMFQNFIHAQIVCHNRQKVSTLQRKLSTDSRQLFHYGTFISGINSRGFCFLCPKAMRKELFR